MWTDKPDSEGYWWVAVVGVPVPLLVLVDGGRFGNDLRCAHMGETKWRRVQNLGASRWLKQKPPASPFAAKEKARA